MQKDIKIKTKPKNNSIRKLDRRVAYTKYMKEKLLKRNRISQEIDNEEEENEINYATNRVTFGSERIGINTAYGVKDTAKYGYEKLKKYIKDKKNKKEEDVSNSCNQDTPIINNKEKFIEKSNNKKLLDEKAKAKNNIINGATKNNNNSKLQLVNNRDNDFNYQESMKKHSVNKIRIKNLSEKKSNVVKTKNAANKIVNTAKKLAEKVTTIVKSIAFMVASGGGIAIIIIIIAVLVAGMFGSAFGFLFSNETPQTEENMSVNSAVNYLDKEIEDEITLIKATTDYDTMRIENRNVLWRELLSVYAVITTNRENKFNIIEMTEDNYDKLSEIFWEVVEVEHYTETYKVRYTTSDENGNKVTKTKTKIRLIINVQAMTLEKMMEHYNMSKSEKKQVEEMMDGKFDEKLLT